jgi:hypothetical protein
LPSNIVGCLNEPVPYLDLSTLPRELEGELERTVARVAASGWYLLGPELEAFERDFASYCGARHCVGVASGMSAIELALRAAGIGPGDEVIVPAYTWIATWLAVTRTGAVPVPVDADPATYNIDTELIPVAIGERTAAIVPVHLRGEPADMEAVGAIAAEADLLVVEDAAQAHGGSSAPARSSPATSNRERPSSGRRPGRGSRRISRASDLPLRASGRRRSSLPSLRHGESRSRRRTFCLRRGTSAARAICHGWCG